MQDPQAKPEVGARVIKDLSFHLSIIRGDAPTIDDVVEQLSVYLVASKASNGSAYHSGADTALSTLADATEPAEGDDVITRLHNARSVLRRHQGSSTGERRRAIDLAIKATNQAIYALTRISRR
jgi:hypothetical protein